MAKLLSFAMCTFLLWFYAASAETPPTAMVGMWYGGVQSTRGPNETVGAIIAEVTASVEIRYWRNYGG